MSNSNGLAKRIFGFLCFFGIFSGCAHVRGPVTGTFMHLGSLNEPAIPKEKYKDYFSELSSLGMHEAIIQTTRIKTSGGCDEGDFEWVNGFPQNLRPLLDEAKSAGIKVYVGLVSTTGICPDPKKGQNPRLVREDLKFVISEYGNLELLDHPALAGWYIPDEPGLGWSSYYPYIADMVKAIRGLSPGKPVLIAPFLDKADLRYAPSDVAKLALQFQRATGVDIQIWQDSVGAGAVDLDWSRPGSRGTVATYFDAISRAIGPDHLWADNELFSWGNPLHVKGAGYRPTAIARFHRQLQATPRKYASKRFVWLEQKHIGSMDPESFAESARFRAAFEAFYGIKGAYLKPKSYRWVSQPDPKYADTKVPSKLTDLRTGDPKNPANAGWVGVHGTADLRVDLGSVQDVDWVGGHVLNLKQYAIAFPKVLDVFCSSKNWDREDWKEIKDSPWTLPVPRADAEYVFANLEPLHVKCRYLKIRFENDANAWTFLSELEIVSSPDTKPAGGPPGAGELPK